MKAGGGGVMRKMACFGMVLAASLLVAGPEAHGGPVRFIVLPEKSQVEFISGTQLGEFRGITRQMNGSSPRSASRRTSSAWRSPWICAPSNRTMRRDQHMHDKVLEVVRFPSATFEASEFRPTPRADKENGEGVIAGALKLHGVERAVGIPVRYTLNGTTLRGEGNLLVKLTDFDMSPPRLLGLKVRDQVTVEIRFVASGE
jgi:hypothetical protein